jgi:hypothetical protein
MLRRRSDDGNVSAVFLTWTFGLLLLSFFVGGLMVEYCIEFWASYAKGQQVDIPFFAAGLAGLLLSWNVALPATIITFILSFCL